jgi:hypothetical protein
MKKRKVTNQVVSVTVPLDILTAIDEYCSAHYIPRTSFFVKAAKDLLDKNLEEQKLDFNMTKIKNEQ